MPKAVLSTTAPFGFDVPPARFLDAFRTLGCTSCQFFRNRQNQPPAREALEVARNAGMSFDSIHGVFGPDIDPSSPETAHRERCLEIYESEGRLALELGGPLVVVHPSRSAAPGETGAPRDTEAARAEQRARWPHLDDFLSRLADVAHRLSVTYLIENLMDDCPLGNDPVLLAEHVMRVKSPLVRMCFDTGHAHATLWRLSPAGRGAAAVALRVCAPAVAYLHVHDNDGRNDSHLMPGRGGETGIDWTAFREALDATGCAAVRMLEVFEDPALSGPGLKDRLAGWMGA